MKQAETVELVAGDFSHAERRRLAEEISLEVDVAERAGFEQVVVGFDFFGQETHGVGVGAWLRAMAIGDGGASRRIASAEVDLEEFYKWNERLPFGMADVIVESQR